MADASLLVGRTLAPDAVEKMRRVVERDAAAPGAAERLISRVRRFLRGR
jgi:hypothetical protein